jgi:transcriptional regulator with AAA-type ATPase domain
MSDHNQQTQTVVPIKKGDVIKKFDLEFVVDKACSVKLSDLFRKEQRTNKIEFKVDDDDGILDLSCLDNVRKEVGQERFLPKKIFVRKYLQCALERRLQLQHDEDPTVVFGSPGVGKSVFAFWRQSPWLRPGVTKPCCT